MTYPRPYSIYQRGAICKIVGYVGIMDMNVEDTI